MKKLLLPITCLIIGCAAGVAGPRLSAQVAPPGPNTVRYEAVCVTTPSRGPDTLSDVVAGRGRYGFRLTALHVGTLTNTQTVA